jgi:hypothetical protein
LTAIILSKSASMVSAVVVWLCSMPAFVEGQVEPAVGGNDQVEGGLDRAAVGDVDTQRECCASVGLDPGGDGLRTGLVEVGHGHCGAGCGEGLRGGLADAAGSAGDEGDLAGEYLLEGEAAGLVMTSPSQMAVGAVGVRPGRPTNAGCRTRRACPRG